MQSAALISTSELVTPPVKLMWVNSSAAGLADQATSTSIIPGVPLGAAAMFGT